MLAQVSDPVYVSFTSSGLRVRTLGDWLISTSRIGWFSCFSLPFYPTKPTQKSKKTQTIKHTESEKKNFLCHILVKILNIKNKGGTENCRREDTKENPINKEKTNQNDIWFPNGNFESQKSLEQCSPYSKRPQMSTQKTVPIKTIFHTWKSHKKLPWSKQAENFYIHQTIPTENTGNNTFDQREE